MIGLAHVADIAQTDVLREQPGDGPAVVFMHGHPDNHHLYDRLVPHLAGRHVVVVDFLGWAEPDKPSEHDYTFANQAIDLDAVVEGLGLERPATRLLTCSRLAAQYRQPNGCMWPVRG